MKVIRWIISIILVFWGLMLLAVSNPLSCCFHILLAFLISPLSTKVFQKCNIRINNGTKAVSLVFLFLTSAITMFTLSDVDSTSPKNERATSEGTDLYEDNAEEIARSIPLTLNETIIVSDANNEDTNLIVQDMDEFLNEENATYDSPLLKVHFIDVGQGDCTLIESSGHYMLIDAGPEDYGTRIQKYLSDNGVSKLDCILLSHPDIDHVGGADVIITKFDIDNIYMSSYEKDNDVYRDLLDAIDYRGYGWETPKAGFQFEIGNAKAVILKSKEYGDANNSSLVVKVSLGDVSFLFTGDSGELTEYDMISYGVDVSSTVYQVGHHGSYTSTSQEFLNAVNPEYAVISCGKDNVYGHPHQETLDKLEARNVKLFRTDEQGNIVATTDGNEISWNTTPVIDYVGGDSNLECDYQGNKTKIRISDNTEEIKAITLDDTSLEDSSSRFSDSASDNKNTGFNSQNSGVSNAVVDATTGAVAGAVAAKVVADSGGSVNKANMATSAGNSNIGDFKNDPVPSGPAYIGNKTNMKLHSASCSGRLPKESNREYFDTLEEAMQAGYTEEGQCKNCTPFY